MQDRGEKELANNLPNFAQSFKMAAKNYRKAAELDRRNAPDYIKSAELCESKAGQKLAPSNTPQGNNYSYGGSNNSNNSGNANKSQTEKKAENVSVTEASEDMTVDEAIGKLNALVGLAEVKEKVMSWVSQVRVFQRRKQLGLPVPEGFSYHLVFTGNPGTGKTTVARLMAQIYKGLGILEGGQLVETARSDLVMGYVGQTAIKTQEVVNAALGGVLFVDEAYMLSTGGDNDFGQEAINTLLKAMEDHRDELVVIVAGYTDLMKEFIDSNPGLKSRFNTNIEFSDYTGDEMKKIFDGLCAKNKYKLTEEADARLARYLDNMYKNRDKNFGNGRTVRNVFQQTVSAQSARIDRMLKSGADIGEEEMMAVTLEDIDNMIG